MFEFTICGFGFEWNGAHTVNVYRMDYDRWADTNGTADYRTNIDCISLDYCRNDHTAVEAMAAALEWVNTNV